MSNTTSPLARMIEGQPVTEQDGHDVVTLTDPTCPACGRGDLVLRRIEVREVIHRVRTAEVYDGGLGLTADLNVSDEAQSDECTDVQSDSIVCGMSCGYEVSGHDVEIDWS